MEVKDLIESDGKLDFFLFNEKENKDLLHRSFSFLGSDSSVVYVIKHRIKTLGINKRKMCQELEISYKSLLSFISGNSMLKGRVIKNYDIYRLCLYLGIVPQISVKIVPIPDINGVNPFNLSLAEYDANKKDEDIKSRVFSIYRTRKYKRSVRYLKNPDDALKYLKSSKKLRYL